MEKFSFAFFSLATLVFIATVNRSEADSNVIDLGGEWNFASSNKTITGTGKSDKSTAASKSLEECYFSYPNLIINDHSI